MRIRGRSLLSWQKIVCGSLIVILPASLSAQDTTGAILQSSGAGVMVNQSIVNPSTALFPDDVIQTQKGGRARIELAGSTADIDSDTVVQFEGDLLVLDHGSVSVNTSRGFRVRVGCIIVTPVNSAIWTLYQVSDTSGKVTVSAFKNDVYIDTSSKDDREEITRDKRSNREIVRESEQKSREEKCGGAYMNPAESPAGKGAILNSGWARLAGSVGIGVLTCWALCFNNDDPISPSHP